MKRIICLVVTILILGCSNVENKSQEAVKSSLKDPNSAQFKNVNGYCGEVNSKNSYGGYVGFRRYVAADSSVLIEGSDGVEPEIFALIWQAHCTPNNLSMEERSKCVKDAYNQSLVMDARLKGVSKEVIKADVLSDNKASKTEIEEGLRDIDRAYNSKLKDKDLYAQDVIAKCIKL